MRFGTVDPKPIEVRKTKGLGRENGSYPQFQARMPTRASQPQIFYLLFMEMSPVTCTLLHYSPFMRLMTAGLTDTHETIWAIWAVEGLPVVNLQTAAPSKEI